jgi:hypothetical protein
VIKSRSFEWVTMMAVLIIGVFSSYALSIDGFDYDPIVKNQKPGFSKKPGF